MIDQSTGKILIGDSSVIITPALGKRGFLVSELGRLARPVVDNGDSNVFSAKAVDNGQSFGLLLIFKNETLVMVTIAKGDGLSSWGEWSLEAEHKRKQEHDRLLEAELGNPLYRFSWGEVESVIDPKTQCSSIDVSYS